MLFNDNDFEQFYECVKDLLASPQVCAMEEIPQHKAGISCLDNSGFVAYVSFRICRLFGWNYAAAARGGLLHDLFLYDWRQKGSHEGRHAFTHPKAALRNATAAFRLNEIEKDSIEKHMWPVTWHRPRYKESFAVNLADTLCAAAEVLYSYRFMKVGRRLAWQ